MLDADEEIIPAMLTYLGKNPDSKDPKDYKAAQDALLKIRPFVRKFHSSEYINAMANGEICMAVGWSGDFSQAQSRAAEKNKTETDEAKKVDIAYFIPKEGAAMWFDSMVVPADAPDKAEATEFINFIMRPDVIAKCSKAVGYANGNLAAQKLMDKALLEDNTVYPDEATQKRLFTLTPLDQKAQRARTDAWRAVKTGG